MTLLEVAATELDGIEAALVRIDAGSYGRCQSCGSPISDDELAADPLLSACGSHR